MRRLATSRYHVPSLAGVSRAAVPVGAQLLAGRRTSRHHQSSCAAASHTPYAPFKIEEDLTPKREPFLDGPAANLDLALKVYYGSSQGPDEQTRTLARQLASSRDNSLATLTAQMILYMSPDLDSEIYALLPQGRSWDQRLSKVTAQGFQRNELFHWVQVILARTSEERAQVFLGGRPKKPVFLLNYMVRNKNLDTLGLMGPERMDNLMRYCLDELRGYLHASQGTDADPSKLITGKTLNPDAAMKTLGRMLNLARLVEPKGIVTAAHIAVLCLQRLAEGAPRGTNTDTDASTDTDMTYRFSCRIFNSFLRDLSIPTLRDPYANRHFNWKAILELLKYSSGLEKPLVIDREAYRAIRGVLLGLSKSAHERVTATALQQTWPPFRIMRDGMEERMSLETFNSRAFKAGAMMLEAGYEKMLPDLVVDSLAGKAPDGSPTIQTRAILPRKLDSLNALWAAQVRATRNAEEAWQAFRHPPQSDLAPDLQVCEQMIFKLLARPADEHHENLPGDGRETFPFSDLNYSDEQKKWLRPPTLSQFVSSMNTAGIPLCGRTLNAVVRRVPTCADALAYIRQSSLPKAQQALLDPILRGQNDLIGSPAISRWQAGPPADIRDLPFGLVHAVVSQLCQSQPNITAEGVKGLAEKPARYMNRLHTAHKLLRDYNAERKPELWDPILRALARPNIWLGGGRLEKNAVMILAMTGNVLIDVKRTSGLSLWMFEHFACTLCRTMQRMLPRLIDAARDLDPAEPEAQSPVLLAFLGLRPHPERTETEKTLRDWPAAIVGLDFDKMMESAKSALKAMWHEGSASRSQGRGTVVRATAAAVNNHMKALAFLGDHEEMAKLLGWTLQNMDEIVHNSESKFYVKTSGYLEVALQAFRAFAEPLLADTTVAVLRQQVEAMGRDKSLPIHVEWPSDQGVWDYLQRDGWGHRQNLNILVEIKKEFRSRDGGGGDGGARREVDEAVAKKSWWENEGFTDGFTSHISRIKAGLAEGHAGPELALYEKTSA